MKLYFLFFFLCYFFQASAVEHFISFIIPSYNCAATVKQSIDSIYNQNLPYSFEVICTNDCSTDNTLAVLKACQKDHSNLFIYSHERNKGGGACRNTCVIHSRGDLIFCLDSDNVLAPNSVNQLIDLINTTNCDVAAFDEIKTFRGNFVSTFSYYNTVPNYTYDLYTWISHVMRNPAHSGNYLFTRKSYDRAGGYLENVGAQDTLAFGMAQLATGSVMKIKPNSFYWHRLHDDSYWMEEEKKNANWKNINKVMNHFSEIFSPRSLQLLHTEDPKNFWQLLTDRKIELASSEILQNLFKGYEFRYQKHYAKAAEEFAKAINAGCKSEKIASIMHQMVALASQ